MVELVLIAASPGCAPRLPARLRYRRLEALLGNVLFFVPFELGGARGSYYVLFGCSGLDPQLGVYTSIVSRLRDLPGCRRLGH